MKPTAQNNAASLLDALSDFGDIAGYTPDGNVIVHFTLPPDLFDRFCAFVPESGAGGGAESSGKRAV